MKHRIPGLGGILLGLGLAGLLTVASCSGPAEGPPAGAKPEKASPVPSATAPATPAAAAPSTTPTTAIRVELARTEDGWQLLRGGKPYVIKGAGGDGPKPALAQCGGNSYRTWAADNLQGALDEAQQLGLTVTIGIWLGHERHGFDYNNADKVAAQYEQVRKSVLQYKDHPALLLWALGNEMEGYAKGDNAAIWSAINNLATLVKKLDPNHPTMTVLAEIGGDKVKNVHRLCPDIDIVGINTYAGVTSIPERYKKAGGTKPYIITEYGPAGVWEVLRNAWGAAPEPTSTEKGESYRQGTLKQNGLCLGLYAFAWGAKEEATATWYGMFLPDGNRLEAVDVMTELWSGKPPANRCPKIKSLKLEGAGQVDPGATVRASVDVVDPEGDSLDIKWVLHRDAANYNTGGDAQQATPSYPEAVVKVAAGQVELKMPADGGKYRLYVFARDGKGGAAVANLPLMVNGPEPEIKAATAKLPLDVYSDDLAKPTYIPSGWMGNNKAIAIEEKCAENPHSGKTCIKAEYREGTGWGGVVWQSPAGDWGDLPGGLDLTGAKTLTFWARGEDGGEKVKFGFGIISKNKKFFDSAKGETGDVILTKEWKQYTIDLSGKDLKRIKTGFYWTLGTSGKPVTFYLDDIRYAADAP